MIPTDDAPPWPDDPFARYLHDAARNQRITASKHRPVYTLLRDIHLAYEEAAGSFSAHGTATATHLVTRFMLVRTHGAFLAASRLGMSAQASDAPAVIRVGVELAWYALHLAKDPDPPRRMDTWLRRNEGKASQDRCKAEFTVARVRATHERIDPATAGFLKDLYENLIDYGAHPNQGGVLAGITRANRPQNREEFTVGILDPNPLTVMFALRRAAILGAGALRVFGSVFSTEFAAIEMDRTLEGLIGRLNTVFLEFGTRA